MILDQKNVTKISSDAFVSIHENYVLNSPNLFLVDDRTYVIVRSNNPLDYTQFLKSSEVKHNDIHQHYLEDPYTEGLYLSMSDKVNKYYVLENVKTFKDFQYQNRDTYPMISFSKVLLTVDKQKLEELFLVYNVYYAIEKKVFKVLVSEEFIKIAEENFEKGEKNKEIYFLRQEKEYFDGMMKYRKFDNTYHKIKNFNTENTKDLLDTKKNNLKFGVESLTYKAFEGIKYTYGIELETIGGAISEEEAKGLNFKTVHDGSLRGANGEDPLGAEYVTGVLIGDSGLTQLAEICRVVGKNCSIDKRCGVHVHIGSLNWNKEEVVFAYLLGELIEKDLFSVLPESRRKNSYCKPLTKILSGKILNDFRRTSNAMSYKLLIDEAYDLIYKEVAFSGKEQNKNMITCMEINKKRNHPKGSKCGYDKNSQRYCWLNFVTLLFDTKGITDSHTIEIRNHGATMNFKKVRNWLKISFAFCRFVEEFKSDILNKNLSLEYIVDRVFPKTGKNLSTYISERKEIFKVHGETIDYLETEVVSKQSIKEVVQCV